MQVAPGISSLGDKRGVRVHAYLLNDGHGVTVVDTPTADEPHHTHLAGPAYTHEWESKSSAFIPNLNISRAS